MADNIIVLGGDNGANVTVAADDVAGVKWPRYKLAVGADGAATDVTDSAPLPSGIVRGTLTDRSGSVTTGGTAQQLAASNTSRRYLEVQNTSAGNLRIRFGATATSTTGFLLLPNESYDTQTFVPTDLVSVWGATTGQTWIAIEG